MASPTLTRLTGRRLAAQHYAEQATPTGETWQRDHANAMFARDVQDWLALFFEEATQLGVLSRNLHRRVRANQLELIEEVGRVLESTLEVFGMFGDVIAGLVEQARQAGHAIEGEKEYQDARQVIARELERVRRAWPRRNPSQVAAVEDMQAGRFQEVGDVLRELQG